MTDECPICLSLMDENSHEECPMCKTPVDGAITTVNCCKKQFHTRCLLKCMIIKSECPMCRAKDCIIQVTEEDTELSKKARIITYTIVNIGIISICLFTVLKYTLHL